MSSDNPVSAASSSDPSEVFPQDLLDDSAYINYLETELIGCAEALNAFRAANVRLSKDAFTLKRRVAGYKAANTRRSSSCETPSNVSPVVEGSTDSQHLTNFSISSSEELTILG